MKEKSPQKGSETITGIGVLFIFGIIALFLGIATGFNDHNTSEGSVNYTDCRTIINLKPDSWGTYFGKFIGTDLRTQDGKYSMGGTFARVETENGSCTTAYVYTQPPDDVCTKAPNLYLGYDDMCYTTPQGSEIYIDTSQTSDQSTSVSSQNTPVTSVELNEPWKSLVVGNTDQLAATVLPIDATDHKVTYYSDAPTVARVDSATGLISAVAPGTANISVTADDKTNGSLSANDVITVTTPLQVQSIGSNNGNVYPGNITP